jgi:hypothetical protein
VRSEARGSTGVWTASTLTSIVAAVALADSDNVPVLLPLLVCIALAALAFSVLWSRRRNTGALCEIGGLYVAVVAAYSVFPLAGYLLTGMRYGVSNDNRLYVLQPSAGDVGRIGWYCAAHLAGFVIAYFLVRGRLPRRPPRFRPPDRATVVALLLAYAVVQTFFLALSWSYELSAETYAGSYTVSSRLPLALAQLFNHVGGARFTIEIALLTAMFSAYERFRLAIVAWLLFVAVSTFAALGSRTELMLVLVASALLYHYLVRPIRGMPLAGAAAVVLAAFMLLGMLRAGWIQRGLPTGLNLFAYASEFEVVFANALHLESVRRSGELAALPAVFYFSDLLSLVPQQMSPVTKIAPAVWYATTFFPKYAASGGGLAFGTIAESVVGWGWPDALLRGILMGIALGWLHRFAIRHRPSFWTFVLYIWASVQVYHAFRNTTFTLLPLFAYRFVPVAVGCSFVAACLRSVLRHPSQGIAPASPLVAGSADGSGWASSAAQGPRQ